MSKHFRVPNRIIAKLKESGVRVPEVLRRAGLPAGLFDQTKVLVTTEELFALWRGIGEVSRDPAIGLLLGTESRPEKYDPVGLAALSAESFGEAVRQVGRYKETTCPEEILTETSDGEWSIQFRWLLAEEPEPEILVDFCFAWVLSLARHGTGERISPVRVEVVQRRANAKVLERHFGCEVVMGASRNALVFRAEDVERRFVTRNADLLAMLAPQLDEELKRQRGQESFPEQVRAAIQRRLTGRRPKMLEVARELRMSARTLQRRLQESGRSFQQMLEEARHELARHYLAYSPLELNETAYLLGYEDSSSFVRAFRGWEGVPPAHWREARRERMAS
ncbi:AraC family transcriptional regulator [Edaphobacter aggregans]|uniref:AraC family transcriptional regulator n=1 Tax=Edaphobacter aggregans TaxID=570835 RepID=UPI00054FFFE8|nr:AraC family transcriptional regulator [Edaphobacter aggregans]